jgi:hypothetical protein
MTMQLISKWLLCCATLLFVGCAAPRSRVDEATIRQWLPGTWVKEERERNRVTVSEKTYFADGTASGQVLLYEETNRGQLVVGSLEFRSKWRLHGVTLESYEVRCSDPKFFEEGEVFVDRVIDIDAEKIVFEDLTNGGVYTNKRERSIASEGSDPAMKKRKE